MEADPVTTDRMAGEDLDSVDALARAFDIEVYEETRAGGDWPRPVVISPRILESYARAQVVRVTLKLARRAGSRGIPVQSLKAVYQAIDVPVVMADLIERKLTADGMGFVSAGRLCFGGRKGLFARLASEKAS